MMEIGKYYKQVWNYDTNKATVYVGVCDSMENGIGHIMMLTSGGFFEETNDGSQEWTEITEEEYKRYKERYEREMAERDRKAKERKERAEASQKQLDESLLSKEFFDLFGGDDE